MKKPRPAEKGPQLASSVIPGIVKVMGEMASDPAAQPQSRLKAIELLLRVGATTHAASGDAKAHLSRAVPFLNQLINSRSAAYTFQKRGA